jgi:GT2 family glycosyltransferase
VQTQFRIICATRASAAEFRASSALGRSLALYPFPFLQVSLCPENTLGLPLIYNAAVRRFAADESVFVFVHDDVHLLDFFWPDRILQGLERFGVVGVAGNVRRIPRQPSWVHVDERFTPDDARYLSGAVAHGAGWPPDRVDYFGTVGREVRLLDGALLAVRAATLRAHDLWFDERFDFHFYDLDFCRQAERAGVTLGTVPMPIVHQSTGNYGGVSWRKSYASYLDKWGEK